jgi:hypothetical protein
MRFDAALQKAGMNFEAIDSWMITRRVQVQRWPVVTKPVGVGHDDGGVVAAHFEGEDAPGAIEVRLHDAASDGPRASEEDAVDAVVS